MQVLQSDPEKGFTPYALFNAQSQREICGAATRHIPLIYSNLEAVAIVTKVSKSWGGTWKPLS